MGISRAPWDRSCGRCARSRRAKRPRSSTSRRTLCGPGSAASDTQARTVAWPAPALCRIGHRRAASCPGFGPVDLVGHQRRARRTPRWQRRPHRRAELVRRSGRRRGDGVGARHALPRALGGRGAAPQPGEGRRPLRPRQRAVGLLGPLGGDWLRRAMRFAYPVTPVSALIIGDATRDDCDPDAPYLRAFELTCVRSGQRPVCLPVRTGLTRGGGGSLEPSAIVIAGATRPTRTWRGSPTPPGGLRALPLRCTGARARKARQAGQRHLAVERTASCARRAHGDPGARRRDRDGARTRACCPRFGGPLGMSQRRMLKWSASPPSNGPARLFCGHCAREPESGPRA